MLLASLGCLLASSRPAGGIRFKEGFVSVGLARIHLSVFVALPFMSTGVTTFYRDALFFCIFTFSC